MFSLIGSFQIGLVVESENPLEEVWSFVQRIGNNESLNRLTPDIANSDWTKHVDYASTRLIQALEFREAADTSSLLTSPLLLYYSFLNLSRAYLAVGVDKISASTHGLTWQSGASILESSARVCKKGTFAELLSYHGIESSSSTTITLAECLSRIPELKSDNILALQSNIINVHVNAYTDGRVHLKFVIQDENQFRTQ